ncbi:unnamed protein product [Staurois parvus]|uniref:Uncharacterized protein n=1 Tax=Staurois parvus TaxID=386267 RepID=A0ABN9F114_9NEOB|nr:unnamed protein product [Staurois parvus]
MSLTQRYGKEISALLSIERVRSAWSRITAQILVTPHKIYQFIRRDSGNITPEDLYCSDSISPSSQLPPFNSPRSQFTVDRNLSQDINQMQISVNEEDLYLDPENLPSSVPTSSHNWYNNISSPDVFVAAASPVVPDISPYAPCQDNTEQVQGTSQEAVNGTQQLLDQFFPNNTFETQFEVKIYYRGILVKSSLVKKPPWLSSHFEAKNKQRTLFRGCDSSTNILNLRLESSC